MDSTTTETLLEVDSMEYDILERAVLAVDLIEGMSCEIGVREGGSSQIIMKTGRKRVHIGIDPYGHIEYRHGEIYASRSDYTNAMRNRAISKLYAWCAHTGNDFLFFCLEDTEFFTRFADGVPVYESEKKVLNQYALVFFDGPHTSRDVIREVEFFASRTPVGGVFVFDDIHTYAHAEVDNVLRTKGFQALEQGFCKMSYIKRS